MALAAVAWTWHSHEKHLLWWHGTALAAVAWTCVHMTLAAVAWHGTYCSGVDMPLACKALAAVALAAEKSRTQINLSETSG